MRKLIYILTMLAVLGFCPSIPGPTLEAGESGKPLRVVCTILPIYCLTLNVVGQTPGVQVELLLPPQQGCPHDYDLTPGDLIKMARADILVANGLGMEEFLGQFLKQTKVKIPVILAAEKVEPILNRPVTERSEPGKTKKDPHHDHIDLLNGHAWVSPKEAAIMVRTIAEGLSLKDPVHARDYGLNARQYAKKLEGIFEEMRSVVSRAKNKKCVAFHDILAYLARDAGFEIVGVIQSQLGVEPSPKHLARLVEKIRGHQAAAIFSEPQYSDKMAQVLSRESGVPVFELDPVATGKAAADTYEKTMRKNLTILQTAFK
jgi:zinc transport system substrate-binding protein